MTINLITYNESLDKLSSIARTHEEILTELELHFSVNYLKHTDLEQLPADEFALIFIASGGVEQLIAHDIEKLPRPIVFLIDGLNNSMAAALETATWMRERGIKNEILHDDLPWVIERIKTLAKNFHAQRRLMQQKIGVIGPAAPWSIASSVDYFLTKQRWGLSFINIPMSRVADIFRDLEIEEDSKLSSEILSAAYASSAINPKALAQALRFYKAVKQVCEEEGLTAVTFNCHESMEEMGVTGCLASAILNDRGITAGCDGDLQTIFTLVMIQALTGEAGFMCSPSQIDTKENKVVLGHCGIATKQVSHFTLREHYASKKAISIQGTLPLGEFTLLKCGGECLDKYFVSSGYILENTQLESTSRTEVLFKMNADSTYFLRNSLSNHHVMIRGNHEDAISSFLETYSCKRIS